MSKPNPTDLLARSLRAVIDETVRNAVGPVHAEFRKIVHDLNDVEENLTSRIDTIGETVQKGLDDIRADIRAEIRDAIREGRL